MNIEITTIICPSVSFGAEVSLDAPATRTLAPFKITGALVKEEQEELRALVVKISERIKREFRESL